jgi:hypothetical protein
MSLRLIQIENIKCIKAKPKAGARKWLKKQRNRFIRRTLLDDMPVNKFKGWEY